MKGVRILLVDDEPEILRLLTRRLRRKGCEVIPATDSGQALALLQLEVAVTRALEVRRLRAKARQVDQVVAASEGEGRGSTFTVRLPLTPQG